MSPLGSSSTTPSTNTPWFAVSIGLMGVIIGYAIGSVQGGFSFPQVPGQVAQNNPTPPAAPDTVVPEPSNFPPPTVDDDPVEGDANAKVTLVEFTDYQCPFCGRHFSQTYGQIKSEYVDTGKIKYVIRDYPLSFHPHAQKAAEASECAHEQGKFWEMHDKLFGNQDAWSALPATPTTDDAVPVFKQYAADLKLNTATFNDCLDTGKYATEIQKDEQDGQTSGISGTPGFWVLDEDGKGQMISGAVPFANFKSTIDAML